MLIGKVFPIIHTILIAKNLILLMEVRLISLQDIHLQRKELILNNKFDILYTYV